MKTHTTNYYNVFIEVAEDCPAEAGEIPPTKGNDKSIANIQFEMISQNPYRFTSDDIIFSVSAIKNSLTADELSQARQLFFSKGQPCLRTSPLTKRYGWGIHNNEEGKVALYGVNTEDYEKLSKNNAIKNIQAMRTSKKSTV
ncbi:MAG: hypothetical protein HOO93_18845 [Methyloglobulus sp.]|mgnify:CR=1 FL=1|nr:hypothetical protein [Methyloglobulus sp.]